MQIEINLYKSKISGIRFEQQFLLNHFRLQHFGFVFIQRNFSFG